MNCRICNNEVGNRHFDVAEMMFGTRERFDYLQCGACGCLQIAEYPADAARYYGPDYYSYGAEAKPKTFIERLLMRWRDRYAMGDLALVGRYLYNREPNKQLAHIAPAFEHRRQRILDVGCGSAKLLRMLDAIGFHEVRGADPFIDEAFSFGRRGKVEKKSLGQVDECFDVVMLHHSLEHMPDQRRAFSDIVRILAPGGTCVLAVPLVDSHAWDEYGVDWVQLDAPRHFYLHTRRSLERLAQEAGLRIREIVYDSTNFQFWGSEQYRQGIPLLDARSFVKQGIAGSVFTRAQMGEFVRRSNELNAAGRGDQAIFFLDRG